MSANSTTIFHKIPYIAVTRIDAVRANNPYAASVSGARRMPAKTETISWDLFKWVVAGLLGLICVLITGAFLWMRSDIGDVKKEVHDLTKEISEARIDLTKAIGAVATQAGGTNSRLDQLIADGRRR